jgi:DNA-binding CsgD family transcriptional regulator
MPRIELGRAAAVSELTSREEEVLHLAADGLSNDEIAGRLEISRRTVEAHMRTLFRKTGVSRRSQLSGLLGEGLGPSAEVEEEHRQRLDRYDTAIARLSARHLTLFEERVDITFQIGNDDGDRVLERRWTTPKPYLTYRMFRPVLAVDPDLGPAGRSDPDGLELACAVSGRDVQADVLAVTEADGLPRVVVLFQPGLSAETEWTLRYRSERLWEPLRRTGADELLWATASPDRRAQPTITAMTVRLVFPAGWTDVGLSERAGVGTVSPVQRRPSGQQVVSWTDENPTATAYEWRLTGTPG